MKALFKPQFVANNVEIKIPVPKNTSQVNGLKDVRVGKAKYKASDNSIVWRYEHKQTEGVVGVLGEGVIVFSHCVDGVVGCGK